MHGTKKKDDVESTCFAELRPKEQDQAVGAGQRLGSDVFRLLVKWVRTVFLHGVPEDVGQQAL